MYSHLMSLLLPVARRFVVVWKRSAHLMATSSGAHVLRATSTKMKNDFMLSLIFQFFIKIFVSYISEILKLRVTWYCTYSALCNIINLYSQLYVYKNIHTIFLWYCSQRGPRPPHSWASWITHNDASQSVELLWTSDQPVAETSTWQHTTLTTNIYAPVGFEPTISAAERPQTYALDRAATGTGIYTSYVSKYTCFGTS